MSAELDEAQALQDSLTTGAMVAASFYIGVRLGDVTDPKHNLICLQATIRILIWLIWKMYGDSPQKGSKMLLKMIRDAEKLRLKGEMISDEEWQGIVAHGNKSLRQLLAVEEAMKGVDLEAVEEAAKGATNGHGGGNGSAGSASGDAEGD